MPNFQFVLTTPTGKLKARRETLDKALPQIRLPEQKVSLTSVIGPGWPQEKNSNNYNINSNSIP